MLHVFYLCETEIVVLNVCHDDLLSVLENFLVLVCHTDKKNTDRFTRTS